MSDTQTNDVLNKDECIKCGELHTNNRHFNPNTKPMKTHSFCCDLCSTKHDEEMHRRFKDGWVKYPVPTYEEWHKGRSTDSYLMDLENSILTWDFDRITKMKKERINDDWWMARIRESLDSPTPLSRDIYVGYYKRWVMEGGGDEWFDE